MKIPFVSKRSHRSNEAAGPSNPSPAPPQQQPSSPASSAAASASSSPPAVAPDAAEEDFILQEEEYQMQLAMALSASASVSGEGGAGDPDGEQIRKAKLMSLGRGDPSAAGDQSGGDTAESLSRRYREYNFLDYNEKVIDGFYDIFGLSAESYRQKKISSLAELQMSIGDLGFEVIVVDHKFDNALREMKDVTQCCMLGCDDISVSVRRIAEVVAEHMGGPVIDANEMFTRWVGKSIEQRTSHQTSLLPIGRIEIGLSRHRALLFKILADSVGIPCKLVKGSHYTGVEDDAISIIKMDDDREYLVDVMAAPGTLIPADVFNSKATSLNANQTGQNQMTDSITNSDKEPVALQFEHNHNQLRMPSNDNWISNNHSRHGETATPSAPNPWADTVSVTAGSSSAPCALVPHKQSDQPSTASTLSKQKEDLKLLSNSQDNEESKRLFSDLNPLRAIGSGKSSVALKGSDNRNNEFQRRRENVAPVPARSQQPLVIKNWSAFNDISNNKQYNFAEGLVPRRNVMNNVASSSQLAWSAAKHYNSNAVERNNWSNAPPVRNYDNGTIGASAMTTTSNSGEHLDKSNMGVASDYEIIEVFVLQANENKENYGKHEHQKLYPDIRKPPPDRFMGAPKQHSGSVSPSQVGSSRVDMVLEDVSECEILWEDLVIGERIGLGSYGEVYYADWNGTEVAVKKFLDQDFYGDALDEFRCEVRIMRRLRHPNIVLFMGAVTRPPNLSIVSEYLPRGSLHKIIHRCELDEKRRIKMALDVARGMNCLHTSVPTIVHRDLKSPNLLVDDNWTVKVCDFGLSRLKHSTFLSSKSTAGTPEWMAPEVLRNEQSNEKCDVYSFGVILWELATLRTPWQGMNPMQVVGAVGFQDRRLDIPKEVDPLVAKIIRDCWQKEPNLRPSFSQLTSYLKTLQRLVVPSHQEVPSPHAPQEIWVNHTP
ncbi:hypothetical protein HU200_049263 [Digitaria exilis]|uniref:non-specific serine/threonine protein kinase n=1 Tax=Digitaria exilis TaxID=1010633 RepID=A0A835AT80_9POAL|nr:hypothetical protein HU200_049263 [Digitaria exilis]